jgi:transaldolase
MKATQELHDIGQSLWLDNITRGLLTSGTLRRYIQEFAAPFTVSTMPEATLNALAEHGDIGQTLPVHARYCDEVLARFAEAGVDVDALGAQLQAEGAKSFVKSWNDLMECIASKSETLATAR